MMPKILIVDDEVIILARLHKLLTRMDYDVVGRVSDGEKAVAMARELNPDLVLMDIKMPGKLNGIAAGGLIHDELGIPLIYITAHSDESNIQKAKMTEPFGFLIKPYRQSELKAAIEIALYKVDADRKIRESEEKYRSLSENISIDIYRTSVESPGKFLEINPAFIKMFGYASKQEILSRPVTDFYSDPKDRDNIIQKFSHCDSLKDVELTLKRKDGTDFFGSLTVTAVKDSDGRIVCLDGVVENITKRKQAEEALHNIAVSFSAVAGEEFFNKVSK